MTYGEYYYLVKYDMRLEAGKWITKKPTISIPVKMTRKLALTYYTQKFNYYWQSITKN